MLDVFGTGSRHVECVSYRKPPGWVCIVLGTAMLGVYRTGNRHVGCVSYREPPCWVCIVLGAAMLYAPLI